MPYTLVLYIFHEMNYRVEHFFKNAIFYHETTDFIVICNNLNIKFEHLLPTFVKVIKRENIGFDFGGWSDCILDNKYHETSYYDYFIFVNSSVIGPFIPSYFNENWTNIYINGLNSDVKLFGSTINAIVNPMKWSHVQSYIFAMDINTLQFLVEKNIFSKNHEKVFHDAIWKREVPMSRKIIENGWNIGCLFKPYKNIDFTFKNNNRKIMYIHDIFSKENRNNLWNDYDLVFIKGNRYDGSKEAPKNLNLKKLQF
uniref:Rhamnan synthesis protein F n=1 Tax=viral metagenome TaxID=1070528 RepID=A0A6C0CNA3_9ZZZZ